MESFTNDGNLSLIAGAFMGPFNIKGKLVEGRRQSFQRFTTVAELSFRASGGKRLAKVLRYVGQFRGQVLNVTFGIVMRGALLADVVNQGAGLRRNGGC